MESEMRGRVAHVVNPVCVSPRWRQCSSKSPVRREVSADAKIYTEDK